MNTRSIALLLALAAIGSGCATKETKTESAPKPAAAVAPVAEAPPPPSVQQNDCQPTRNTKSNPKGKGKKDAKPAAADCPPDAKPAPVAAQAPAPAKEASNSKPTEPGKPRAMKSRDGTFEGEVYGIIPPNSKWAKLQIGMEQAEVERILGTSHEVRTMPTAKAFIPFYYGTDRHRYEVVYRGQGSVSYTGGGIGGGRGILMMINYDSKI